MDSIPKPPGPPLGPPPRQNHRRHRHQKALFPTRPVCSSRSRSCGY